MKTFFYQTMNSITVKLREKVANLKKRGGDVPPSAASVVEQRENDFRLRSEEHKKYLWRQVSVCHSMTMGSENTFRLWKQ